MNDPGLDHMAETGFADIGAVEMNRSCAARVPHLHITERIGTPRHDWFPDTERLENPLRGAGDRENARVAHTIVGIAGERPRLDQSDSDARLTQSAGRRRTHDTGPYDNDVKLAHGILTEENKFSPQRRKVRRENKSTKIMKKYQTTV
jgi:hypothetical protein